MQKTNPVLDDKKNTNIQVLEFGVKKYKSRRYPSRKLKIINGGLLIIDHQNIFKIQ